MKLCQNVLLILICLVIIRIGAYPLQSAGLGVIPSTANEIGLSRVCMQLGIFKISVNAFIYQILCH